jgi:hypothetical protein
MWMSGVREHFEHVIARVGAIVDGLVQRRLGGPGVDPLGLDLLMVVWLIGGRHIEKRGSFHHSQGAGPYNQK